MCIFPTPKSQVTAQPAPQKTDADVAQAAERSRQALSLSTRGFEADSYGTFGQGFQQPSIKRIVLGA